MLQSTQPGMKTVSSGNDQSLRALLDLVAVSGNVQHSLLISELYNIRSLSEVISNFFGKWETYLGVSRSYTIRKLNIWHMQSWHHYSFCDRTSIDIHPTCCLCAKLSQAALLEKGKVRLPTSSLSVSSLTPPQPVG